MKNTLVCSLILFLSGCCYLPSKPQLIDKGDYKVDLSHPSAAQNSRARFLILHYTAVNDAESLRLLTRGDASAHYLVTTSPTLSDGKPVVLGLVPENRRAWHAGVSQWQNRTNLNNSSIGIEIVNTGYSDKTTGRTWAPYTPQQLALVKRLVRDIIKRHAITPDNILGHSDIAPQRKVDPGPLFPWQTLAEEGIGAWPDAKKVSEILANQNPYDPVPVKRVQIALAKYGYQIPCNGTMDEETRRVISVFQMHFRPANYAGFADAETAAIAEALVDKYR